MKPGEWQAEVLAMGLKATCIDPGQCKDVALP
jgi:hypothetical protein